MPPAKKAAPTRTPAKKAAARPAAKKAPAKKTAAKAPAAEAAPPAPAPAPDKPKTNHEPGSRNLGHGSVGEDVALVQKFVADALGDDLAEDGVYGPKTEKAVKRWQKSRGRQLHGEIRKADWKDILADTEQTNTEDA